MEYIARHYNMELALAWALRLEGKTDQKKFKEIGWGLRTWDQWNFNECLPREIHVNDKRSLPRRFGKSYWGVFHWGDERFGDDWPGRIPAQLIAHTLFYFTKPGDLILDPTRPPRLKAKPMAGRWPAEALSLMCAFSLGENVNLLISQSGTIVLRYCAITGTPGIGSGRSQKNRI